MVSALCALAIFSVEIEPVPTALAPLVLALERQAPEPELNLPAPRMLEPPSSQGQKSESPQESSQYSQIPSAPSLRTR